MVGAARSRPARQPFWRESDPSRQREGSALASRMPPSSLAAIETSLLDESSAGASGSVADAIEQFKAGKLAAVTAADVAGPWT